MVGLKSLIEINDLKTNVLKEHAREPRGLYTYYDKAFDALSIMLIAPDYETIVFYVDEHVAILYDPRTLEIVGLQVEAFERSFLPQHEGVKRVWRLSAALQVEDAGDLILAAEKIKTQVSCEVAKATQDVLGEPGVEFARVFQCA